VKDFFTSPRHFNDIQDHGTFIIKSSINLDKISAEINFYENLTSDLKRFYPKYLGKTEEGKWPIGYKLEKIPNYDLSIYFIQRKIEDPYQFNNIFELINNYLNNISKKVVSKDDFFLNLNKHIIDRNLSRCHALKSTTIFTDVDNIFIKSGFEGIFDFLAVLNNEIRTSYRSTDKYELWSSHGDLCLSNMIVHDDKLFLIDPRGYRNDVEDSFLVPEYDLAKLSQCFYGGYDFINHNTDEDFIFNLRNDCDDFIQNCGKEVRTTRLIEASHFLAMLPLHINSNNKVLRFAQKAISVFQECK
jgi:hypothetical protein